MDKWKPIGKKIMVRRLVISTNISPGQYISNRTTLLRSQSHWEKTINVNGAYFDKIKLIFLQYNILYWIIKIAFLYNAKISILLRVYLYWSINILKFVAIVTTFSQSYSINADDTESELAAIPESPKSDSTLHGSSAGSFGELEDAVPRNFQEPRASIISDKMNVIEPNNQNIKSKTESITKPIWFLGNEDDACQVNLYSTKLINIKWSLDYLLLIKRNPIWDKIKSR